MAMWREEITSRDESCGVTLAHHFRCVPYTPPNPPAARLNLAHLNITMNKHTYTSPPVKLKKET